MTAADPNDPLTRPTQYAVLLHRQYKILATGGMKTAIPSQPRADPPLIAAYSKDDELGRNARHTLQQLPPPSSHRSAPNVPRFAGQVEATIGRSAGSRTRHLCVGEPRGQFPQEVDHSTGEMLLECDASIDFVLPHCPPCEKPRVPVEWFLLDSHESRGSGRPHKHWPHRPDRTRPFCEFVFRDRSGGCWNALPSQVTTRVGTRHMTGECIQQPATFLVQIRGHNHAKNGEQVTAALSRFNAVTLHA